MLAGLLKAPSRYNPVIDPKAATDAGEARARQHGRRRLPHRRRCRRASPKASANLHAGRQRAASISPTGCWIRCRASSATPIAIWWSSPRSTAAAARPRRLVAKILSTAPTRQECQPGGAGRADARRRGPGDGRRARLRQQPVQPRDPGAAPARLRLQAVRLSWPPWRRGMTPDDRLIDGPISHRQLSAGQLRRQATTARVTLREAFARSLNSVAVQLSERVGRRKVIETARPSGYHRRAHAAPSIALGTSEVSLLEMTGAYAAFANRGEGVWPYGIAEIRDRDGNVALCAAAAGPGRVVGARACGEMQDMMASVIESGTGKAAALDRPGGRQDRHQPGLSRCLVHRLHRRSGDRRLGRQ